MPHLIRILNIFGLRFPALPFLIFFFLKKKKKERKKIFQRIFIYGNERWGGEDKKNKKHVSKRNKERKRARAI